MVVCFPQPAPCYQHGRKEAFLQLPVLETGLGNGMGSSPEQHRSHGLKIMGVILQACHYFSYNK